MSVPTQAPADPEPLLLAVLGMDERQLTVLTMVITRHCRDEVQVVPEARAQACLLDMDSLRAGERLLELRRRTPPLPLLLVSVQPLADEALGDDLFVKKPIATEKLLEGLTALTSRCLTSREPPAIAAVPVEVDVAAAAPAEEPTQPSPVATMASATNDSSNEQYLLGTATDIDASDPGQLFRIHYDPARYLQGLVADVSQEAAARGQAALIRGPWPSITLMPTLGLAQIAGSDEHLRVYGIQPDMASRAKVSYLPLPVGAQRQPGVLPLESLVWKLSLWASRGRLPARTPLDTRVRLRAQPDFSRLAMTPGAARIAVFWSNRSGTLAETPSILQLPQRQVFGFYSAAKAVGLITEQANAATATNDVKGPDTEPAKYVPGSFARRFLARLRNSS